VTSSQACVGDHWQQELYVVQQLSGMLARTRAATVENTVSNPALGERALSGELANRTVCQSLLHWTSVACIGMCPSDPWADSHWSSRHVVYTVIAGKAQSSRLSGLGRPPSCVCTVPTPLSAFLKHTAPVSPRLPDLPPPPANTSNSLPGPEDCFPLYPMSWELATRFFVNPLLMSHSL
jgi:hypothetical protein